jgi:hypothetical protein
MNRWQRALLVGIALAMCAIRFVDLDGTPSGFYMDEAAGAANMICIATEGVSEKGVSFPLFFEEFQGDGTFFTPAYVYSGALWTKLFGSSIASVRAHVALYAVLTVFGVAAVGWRMLGRDAGLLAGLAAAVSPWSFQFSRIAWDPPLMPCFLVWGIFFLFRKSALHAVFSGVLLAAAMYSYPPARAQVPLLLPVLILVRWLMDEPDERRLRSHGIFWAIHLGTLGAILSPLVVRTLDGTLGGRFSDVGILNREWLLSAYGDASIWTVLAVFGRNLGLHFSGGFLFLRGDANLRHGTGLFGVLSWIDMLALLAAMTIAIILVTRRSSRGEWGSVLPAVLLSLLGVLSGFSVSSLTREGIPHALRSIGSWPFLSLLTGTILWAALRLGRGLPYVIATIAMAFSISFSGVYFFHYGQVSSDQFDGAVKYETELAVRTGDWQPLLRFARFYPKPAMSYYYMHYGGVSCSERIRAPGVPRP